MEQTFTLQQIHQALKVCRRLSCGGEVMVDADKLMDILRATEAVSKGTQVTVEELKALPIGDYAVFRDNELIDLITKVNTNEFWDWYEEFGSDTAEAIIDRECFIGCELFPIALINKPLTI